MDFVSQLCDLSITTCIIGITTFFIVYNYVKKEPWRNLPPGPPAVPLLGSIPFLGVDIRQPLVKMAAKYGDVFTVYLGGQRVVVLNGYDVIKEAFAKDVFSARPYMFLLTELLKGYGLVSTDGELWQEQRRHSLHILRDLGFGRNLIKDRILSEIDFFIEEMKKNTGTPFNPRPLLQRSVANVIASVTFGHRFDQDDEIFLGYLKLMDDSFDAVGNSGILQLSPSVRFLPGDMFHYKKVLEDRRYMEEQYLAIIEQHKEIRQRTDIAPSADFIDSYLQKMEEELKCNKKDTSFTDEQLTGIVGDLFYAGTDTTSTTLTWAILFMVLNPQIQHKIHTEIDDVIADGAQANMTQRSRLPFTEACLSEVQRLGDTIPLGIPHATTEDVHFHGYFIPKNTMIMPNMYSVHHDPKHWLDPYKFDPGRFLSEEGTAIKREELIPFSVGKRVCLGESLARMELFLYFTSMMKHFRFRHAEGHPPPDPQGILTIINQPKPFKIIVETRS